MSEFVIPGTVRTTVPGGKYIEAPLIIESFHLTETGSFRVVIQGTPRNSMMFVAPGTPLHRKFDAGKVRVGVPMSITGKGSMLLDMRPVDIKFHGSPRIVVEPCNAGACKATHYEIDGTRLHSRYESYHRLAGEQDVEELDDQRMALTVALSRFLPATRTMGTDGYFLVNLALPGGWTSFCYRVEHWGKFDHCPACKVPSDGHTSDDTIQRLLKVRKDS